MDRRDEILSSQLRRYSLKVSDISHGTNAIPHAIKLSMDVRATEMCLELLEYMAKKGMMCFIENGESKFTSENGYVLISKEQLFENFL